MTDVREFVAVDAVAATDTISQRRVTMKVAGLGGFADLTGKYRFLLSAWMMSLTVDWAPSAQTGSIGLDKLLEKRDPPNLLT